MAEENHRRDVWKEEMEMVDKHNKEAEVMMIIIVMVVVMIMMTLIIIIINTGRIAQLHSGRE